MRLVRSAWPLIFLIPLTPLAGKFCRLLPTDTIYHSLIFLHERLPLIVALLVTASVVVTLAKLAAVHRRVRTLRGLASPVPARIQTIASRETEMLRTQIPHIAYLDVLEPLCFAMIGGPLIVLSRGFVDRLRDEELRLVLRHEITHIRLRDPLRGVLVHLACGALLVPGFEAIERALYLRRETRADAVAARESPEEYSYLVARLSRMPTREASICQGVALAGNGGSRTSVTRKPLKWTRFIPSGAAAALIIGVVASHIFFDDHLNYLLTHHC